jgi:hypothetical protein
MEASRGLRNTVEEYQVIIDETKKPGIGRLFLDRPYQEFVEKEQDAAFADIVVDAVKGFGDAGLPDMVKVFLFVVADDKFQE